MMIEYLPLKRITAMHAGEIHEAIRQVVDGGWYLRGEATARFEEDYARYIGTRYCVSVANGLDALTLMLRAYKELGVLHEGDEIIVPANTFIATILSVTENRLTPVLVEPSIDTLQIDDTLIEQAVTPRTKAILLVHLYGRCAYTPRILAICKAHNLLLLEDNAQAHGLSYSALPPSPASPLECSAVPLPPVSSSECSAVPPSPVSSSECSAVYPQRKTGSLGAASAHSFYPGKNLGALGDAGAVTTDDYQLAETIRSIANYGSSRKYVFDYVGRNSRMDDIQAAVLSVKLNYLDADNARRQQIARLYQANISNALTKQPIRSLSVYHIYPVLSEHRDRLQSFLSDKGIQTAIHYPIPPHRQKCYSQYHHLSLPVTEQIHAQELSFPCHQAMTEEEVSAVIAAVNSFSL